MTFCVWLYMWQVDLIWLEMHQVTLSLTPSVLSQGTDTHTGLCYLSFPGPIRIIDFMLFFPPSAHWRAQYPPASTQLKVLWPPSTLSAMYQFPSLPPLSLLFALNRDPEETWHWQTHKPTAFHSTSSHALQWANEQSYSFSPIMEHNPTLPSPASWSSVEFVLHPPSPVFRSLTFD